MTTRIIVTAAVLLAASAVYATVYFVDASRPDDSGDGLTWATAKQTIQAAVDLATDGDTVLVTNGVYATGETVTPGYACSNRVVITNNITVRSVNGPAVTIVQGQGLLGTGAVRCVYMSAGLLSGLTLQNGATLDYGNKGYDQSGGGVNMYGGNGVVSNCTISGNRAQWDGGGTCGGTVNNCVISSNRAKCGGGTYYSTVNNCAISGNSAGCGGGMGYGTVNNSTISNNRASSGGGTYYSTVTTSTIINNRADVCGGGAYHSVVNYSTISDNTAGQDGGGTCSGGAVNNSVISGNTAGDEGGGVDVCTLLNCTLANNVATNKAGGAAYATMMNCIIYFNACINAPASSNYVEIPGYISYSCTAPVPAGPGNTNADPRFVNAMVGDFHLQEDSPCVNSGTNLPEMAWQTDLDGNPRVYDGRVDMGCYEFVPEPVAGVALVVVLAGTWRRHVRC